MMDREDVARIAQTCFQSVPTLVIGSGASMPYDLPSMTELQQYLHEKVDVNDGAEQDAWLLVETALSNDDHLEAALEKQQLPPSLLEKIVSLTWDCINEKDVDVYTSMASSAKVFPLGSLLMGLFKSTTTKVDLITTNYDRVVEYACNSAGLLYQTGFAPGYVQKWQGTDGVVFRMGPKPARVVNIWKVHGSLDWFYTPDDRTVGLPVFSRPSDGSRPLIVTPGLNKYEAITQDPFRTIFNGADSSLKNASAFLCIGYGFRDKQIHPKIIERCKEKNVPIIVLARNLTEEARNFLMYKAGNNYLGIESCENGSRVFIPKYPEGIEIEGQPLWSLDSFNELIL